VTAQLKIMAAIILAGLLFLGYNYIGARAVNIYKAEQLVLQLKVNKEKQDKYDVLAEKYEGILNSRKVKVEYVDRVVTKVIEKPVYQNVCFEQEGLEAVNKALRGD